MNKPYPPGHLKVAMPTLKQADASREGMSKKSRQYWTLQKLQAPALNWKQK